MVLPDAKTNPVLLMRFTPNTSPDLIIKVIERLSQCGIMVVTSEGIDDGDDDDKKTPPSGKNDPARSVVLGLTTTQKLLETEAEILHLVKPSRTNYDHIPLIMEHFTVDAREDFINLADDSNDVSKSINSDIIQYDSEGLFTSADRALLLESILDAIPVLCKDEDSSDLTRLFDSLNVSYYASLSPTKLLIHSMRKGKEELSSTSASLCHVLKSNGLVDVICPVHIHHIRDLIQKETFSLTSPPPLQAIRNYYGEGVAFYFAWMHHMTRWTIFPGLLGLAVYLLRCHRGETIDDCEITPLFGFMMFLWAVLCVRYWDREEARLAYKWGTFRTTNWDKKARKRPTFVGEMSLSPVTGRLEKQYPASARRLKLVTSTFITLLLLCGACVVMVISLNIQGYISREDVKKWDSSGQNEHPLYFEWFAKLADGGNMFDSNSWWKCYLPVILRAVAVTTMNSQYSKVAEQLTEWENHETAVDHSNSLIVKRFLFEAFDAYIILFYLAIYEGDIKLLRAELVGAFNIDTFRRLFTESILPYINRKFAANKKDPAGASKKNDDRKEHPSVDALTSEADLDEYDQFDDYIEMLIQFGYITLFASAYPFASFIAVFGNLVEYRSDIWKLGHLCRRSNPVQRSDIGSWKLALRVMVYTSALTNCLIFAYTSSQMQQWIPENYSRDEHGRLMLVPGRAHETVAIMFAIEHVLLMIGVFVRSVVRRVPKDVAIEVEKRDWMHEMISTKARLQSMRALDVRNSLLQKELRKSFNNSDSDIDEQSVARVTH